MKKKHKKSAIKKKKRRIKEKNIENLQKIQSLKENKSPTHPQSN